jgi:predicted GH43/DUF377 family glycosyl hydrolase
MNMKSLLLVKLITLCSLVFCSAFPVKGQQTKELSQPSAEFIAMLKANYEEQKRFKHTGEFEALSQIKFCDEAAYSDNAPWRIGPFTQDTSLTFKKEKQWKDPLGIGWESGAIFVPSLIIKDEKLYMIYRAAPKKETTSCMFGLAVYDGKTWKDYEKNPILYPMLPNENASVEDPIVYRAEGRYFLFYTAVYKPSAAEREKYAVKGHLGAGKYGADINLAVSDDLKTWKRLGLVMPRELSHLWAKSPIIAKDKYGNAVKINGKYLMFVSEGGAGKQYVGTSDNMLDWKFEHKQFIDISSLEGKLFGVACLVAEENGDGLVSEFFYQDKHGKFATGQAYYKKSDPYKQLAIGRGGAMAWGGLIQYKGKWIVGNGWDAPDGSNTMLFYTAPVKSREEHKTLFIEAWIAPQEYPFNTNAIVNQVEQDWKGFCLGLNYQGKLVGSLYADDKQQLCYSPEDIPLLKWSHVAMSYTEGTGMTLYVNGKSVATKSFTQPAIFANKEIPVDTGKCQIKQIPAYTSIAREDRQNMDTDKYKIWMKFKGKFENVKVGETLPDLEAWRKAVASDERIGKQILSYFRLPGSEIKPGTFGAFYTRLKYDDAEWENTWRVSDHPDIVVRFPDSPVKYVFWRGTCYTPAIVSENNIWITDQCAENAMGLGECYEALSDRICRYSHVRVIENTPVRTVIHWRNALSSVQNKIAMEDESGWGDWSDEYWTIYPDGVAVRKQILHSPHCTPDNLKYEFDQLVPLNAAGTRSEDNLETKALTIADLDGNTATYSWEKEPPKVYDKTKYQPIELINTKSKYKPFFVFDEKRVTKNWTVKANEGVSNLCLYSHWPVAQIMSTTTAAVRPDKPTHTSLDATPFDKNGNRFLNVVFGPNNTVIYRSLIGATTQDVKTVIPLARSWNMPPKLEVLTAGWENKGYDVYQRAYILRKTDAAPASLKLTLHASEQSPLYNVCIVLENTDNAAVKVKASDGSKITPTVSVIQELSESKTLLWLPLQGTKKCSLSCNIKGR